MLIILAFKYAKVIADSESSVLIKRIQILDPIDTVFVSMETTICKRQEWKKPDMQC